MGESAEGGSGSSCSALLASGNGAERISSVIADTGKWSGFADLSVRWSGFANIAIKNEGNAWRDLG